VRLISDIIQMCVSTFGHIATTKLCEGQYNEWGSCASSVARDMDYEQISTPLNARDITFDGSCGTWSGKTCAEGFCCRYDAVDLWVPM
jgi:hypothetical protein